MTNQLGYETGTTPCNLGRALVSLTNSFPNKVLTEIPRECISRSEDCSQMARVEPSET